MYCYIWGRRGKTDNVIRRLLDTMVCKGRYAQSYTDCKHWTDCKYVIITRCLLFWLDLLPVGKYLSRDTYKSAVSNLNFCVFYLAESVWRLQQLHQLPGSNYLLLGSEIECFPFSYDEKKHSEIGTLVFSDKDEKTDVLCVSCTG